MMTFKWGYFDCGFCWDRDEQKIEDAISTIAKVETVFE